MPDLSADAHSPRIVTLAHPLERLAVFGGVYSNHLALEAVLDDAHQAGAERVVCLGDVGAFGPHPDRAADRLRTADVLTIQGNYDDSVGRGLDDCQCGYTDPRDNYFADLSYQYTITHTSARNRAWFRGLPTGLVARLGPLRLRMAHGSPRRINEFLWETSTPEAFIGRLLREHDTDLILVTHTGLPWRRFIGGAPGHGLINVGAIGRPANDGTTEVSYALLTVSEGRQPFVLEQRRVAYDHARLSREMDEEGLPAEFIETIETGWWTTCLEALPAKERVRGRW